MMTRFGFGVCTFCLALAYLAPAQAQVFARPTGIYALSNGTAQPLPRLGNIRNLPFVDGYAWRVGWKDFEVSPGVFDFSAIDQVVAALEPLGQKLNLGMHAGQVPDYILALPNVTTYVATGSGGDFTAVVPWDETALGLWEAFYLALANHPLPDASKGGQLVAFRDHPVLEQVRAQIVGLGAGIRDRGNRLTSVATFDRNIFTAAALRAIHASVDLFPGKFHDLPFFPDMNDGIISPTILDHLLDTFRVEFDGVSNPRLGLFEENLACATPSTIFAWPLFQEKENTFVNFQMLQGWKAPFSNPDRTNVCLTDTTGPDVGISYGFNTYNCRYFELYVADLDWPGFAAVFQAWHDTLANLTPTSVEDRTSLGSAKFHLKQNYPNPFNPTTTIHFSIPQEEHVTLKVFDVSGREVAKLLDEDQRAGTHQLVFTAEHLASGVYFYRLQTRSHVQTRRWILLK